MKNRSLQRRIGWSKSTLVGAVMVAVVGLGPVALAANDAAPSLATVTQPAPSQDAGVIKLSAVAPNNNNKAEVPEVDSNTDILAKAKVAIAAYAKLKKARDNKDDPTKFAWAGLIAAISALLLAGVKRTMKLTGKAKKILPWVAVGLGTVGAIALHYAGGMSIFDSVLMGGAAPFSVVLHELGLIPIKGEPEPKTAA